MPFWIYDQLTIPAEMDFPDFYFIIKPIVKQELVMKIMAMYAYENTKYVYGHALLSKMTLSFYFQVSLKPRSRMINFDCLEPQGCVAE